MKCSRAKGVISEQSNDSRGDKGLPCAPIYFPTRATAFSLGRQYADGKKTKRHRQGCMNFLMSLKREIRSLKVEA